jgi:hypothetical protein
MGMIACLLAVADQELQAILKDPTQLEIILEDEEDRAHDIDKAWDGIIYLLTGHPLQDSVGLAPDLSRVIFSGQVVDDQQDLGMGPAHYLTPIQVAEASAELSLISSDTLRERFDPAAMMAADVYPGIWEGADIPQYLLDSFDELKEVYASAAADGDGMITFLA